MLFRSSEGGRERERDIEKERWMEGGGKWVRARSKGEGEEGLRTDENVRLHTH